MNEFFSRAHLHLLVNHAPVFGALFGVALLAASFIWMPDALRRTALVVLVATGVAGAVADGMLLISAWMMGAMLYTALLGGRVRHTEVRPGAKPADAALVEPARERPGS